MSPSSVRANPRTYKFPLGISYTGVLASPQGTAKDRVQLEQSAGGGSTQATGFFQGTHWIYMITGLTAAGQMRRIKIFTTGAVDLTVYPAFTGQPIAGDQYVIFQVLSPEEFIVTCVGGGADYITLPASSWGTITNDAWNGFKVDLIGGAGGNVNRPVNERTCVDYDGSNKRLYVDKPWDQHYGGSPGNNSILRIHGALYSPLSSLEVADAAGTALKYSLQKGGMGLGNFIQASGFDHSSWPTITNYVELAATAASQTVVVSRWE